MNTIDAMRVATAIPNTAERIQRAWWHAHPVVRRATAAAFATSVVVPMVWSAHWWLRLVVAATGVLLALAALVDVHELKIPNRLLALAALVALAGPVALHDRVVLIRVLVGSAVAGGALLVVGVRRGVGMGDVKMGGVVGGSVGSAALLAAPIAIAIAALCAAVFGALTRRRRVALGPALWVGWALTLMFFSTGWWR